MMSRHLYAAQPAPSCPDSGAAGPPVSGQVVQPQATVRKEGRPTVGEGSVGAALFLPWQAWALPQYAHRALCTRLTRLGLWLRSLCLCVPVAG